MRRTAATFLAAGLVAVTAIAGHADTAQETSQPPAAATSDARPACDLDAGAIFERVGPSVVHVIAFGVNPFRVSNRINIASGTAFSIGDGLFATNFHVVVDAKALAIKQGDQILDARLVGRDPLLAAV